MTGVRVYKKSATIRARAHSTMVNYKIRVGKFLETPR